MVSLALSSTARLEKADTITSLELLADLAWWFDFVFTKLGTIQPSTRALVRVLDSRDFAKDACDFASDETERTLQQSFKRALTWLPKVDSVLLDGHSDLDPSFLAVPSSTDNTVTTTTCPLLLSMANCPYQLPGTFFNSPSIHGLVYLDISGIPGSIALLIQPGLLPGLRILKIRHRELDDATFTALVGLYKLRLWSLDITGNKASDKVIDTLKDRCFPVTPLRSTAHFQVEGKLAVENKGTQQYGPFITIQESELSASFDHPERFFVDAPIYFARPDQGPQEYHAFRSDGLHPIRRDSADAASAVLSEGDMAVEDFRASHGLTHLHLSNNNISATGLEKLVRNSNGQIENLSCDSMPLLPPSGDYSHAWPPGARLYGILGAAHVFRPVFSSNLRVLRMHHSIVTHIPTLELEDLSTLARIHIAENAIRKRVDDAFPQAFVPDMNPRLTSLTLTRIPRRSSGPIVHRLIAFLRLLSIQERAIQDVSLAASSWRAPGMLKGLRHLRLEFEPDPMQDGFSASEDLDAEELMNSGDPGFSFFGNKWAGRVAAEMKPKSEMRDAANSSAHGDTSFHSARDDEEYMTYRGEWNEEAFSLPVWIGKTPASTSVMDEYRKLVIRHDVRDGVGSATPAQILAGVPRDSYVFHTAWCMAVLPKHLPTPPTSDLVGMKDVLEELRKYRLGGRAKYAELRRRNGYQPAPLGEPHFFWTGKLEVSIEEPAAHGRPSQYWR